ncbi:MAG: type I methionyl aminopeptidase [Patescibacteria group bacterium]|jgi:methionyl aminopeptidase|nr:type I methionyl aminopeptidase [Patescibacteria group bacterium]
MITIKKPEEVAVIRQGGQILAQILRELLNQSKVGVTTREIDELAEKMIIEAGGLPAFKNYPSDGSSPPFPSTVCASVNQQLVHTPPSDYRLQDGDIFTIDIGMEYPAKGRGFFTDMAFTVAVGKVPKLTKKLLTVTQESLMRGIQQVRPGNHISDISKAVQHYVEQHGFSVVRQLVGHGVGYEVHEEPRIPNFYDPRQTDFELQPGMVLAIEPMVNIGEAAVDFLSDGWTVVTADNSLCAHFEHTVAVTERGVEILTR